MCNRVGFESRKTKYSSVTERARTLAGVKWDGGLKSPEKASLVTKTTLPGYLEKS